MPAETFPSLDITFHDNLRPLLPHKYRRKETLEYPLTRRASIKDIIESLRVPHTEIERIILKDKEIPFSFIPQGREQFHIFPLSPPLDITRATLLRPEPLAKIRFQVDINVGKLAQLLRMTGFDTAYSPKLPDVELAETAVREQRILLSRDRTLLMRSIVTFGHLVRTENPEQQLVEILNLYDLATKVRPFTRCLRCNGLLEPIAKKDILHRLKPLTKKYYTRFHRCPECDHIYWRGSHHERMHKLITDMPGISFAL